MIANVMVLLSAGILLAAMMGLIMCAFSWRWMAARTVMAITFVMALSASIATVLTGASASLSGWFRIDALVSIVLLLISFIAWIVLRYASRNFDQDPDGQRFLPWFLATVIAVVCVVSGQTLVVFWLAWVAISLCFHQLLMFYPARPRAALAAHKKFILARIAEVCLAVAFFLLWQVHGTLDIPTILAAYPVQALGNGEQAAAILLAVVALIKCAQLPVHGWLIQVVEAPTPVSALLHAGVINLGGFLLILFAPLFSLSVAAQTLVIVVAGLSMLIAGLVMMTRISIKVRLAWSTTAQMALMLVECALGLYELALLHMLAHSCYKAFAFLSSGDDVTDYLRAQRREQAVPGLSAWLVAACIIVPGVAITALLGGMTLLPLAPWLMISTALMVLTTQFVAAGGWHQILRAAGLCLLLLAFYLFLKSIMTSVIPGHDHAYSPLFDVWVISLFVVQVLGYLQLQYRPASLPSHRLFIALNAGFYLDEWMTRLTLKWWPIALPRDNNANPAVQPGVMQHD